MIRKATEADTERLIEMGLRFAAETGYEDLCKPTREKISATVAHLLGNPEAAIFVSGDALATGMIGVLLFEHPFSGERVASEVVWWVDPEARGEGVRLLHEAEDWARSAGATKMTMVAPNDRVGALYARLGYAPVEVSYQRSL